MYFIFRFLANINGLANIRILDQKRRPLLNTYSDNTTQFKILKGYSDVLVDGDIVMKNFRFRAGAAYTINLFRSSDGKYVSSLICRPFACSNFV